MASILICDSDCQKCLAERGKCSFSKYSLRLALALGIQNRKDASCICCWSQCCEACHASCHSSQNMKLMAEGVTSQTEACEVYIRYSSSVSCYVASPKTVQIPKRLQEVCTHNTTPKWAPHALGERTTLILMRNELWIEAQSTTAMCAGITKCHQLDITYWGVWTFGQLNRAVPTALPSGIPSGLANSGRNWLGALVFGYWEHDQWTWTWIQRRSVVRKHFSECPLNECFPKFGNSGSLANLKARFRYIAWQ